VARKQNGHRVIVTSLDPEPWDMAARAAIGVSTAGEREWQDGRCNFRPESPESMAPTDARPECEADEVSGLLMAS
jgi:hypothetical protein